MPIAVESDWIGGFAFLGAQGEVGMRKWDLILELNTTHIPKLPPEKTYLFYQLRNSLHFKIGFWTTETIETKNGFETRPIFEDVFKMDLSRYKLLEQKINYKKLVNVDGVVVIDELSDKGIATFIYKYLVNSLGYTILSDAEQFLGARATWSRLSKDVSMQVDVVDILTKEVLYENAILYQGRADEDFDERIWDYSEDKKHIRCVLAKIL